jgi:hypothetical protein
LSFRLTVPGVSFWSAIDVNERCPLVRGKRACGALLRARPRYVL